MDSSPGLYGQDASPLCALLLLLGSEGADGTSGPWRKRSPCLALEIGFGLMGCEGVGLANKAYFFSAGALKSLD